MEIKMSKVCNGEIDCCERSFQVSKLMKTKQTECDLQLPIMNFYKHIL